MRIDSVKAIAFGPLKDATLDFAPGMTVVWGVNESAKSSWHATTYAALCGRRRGKGRPVKEDARFEEQHRPWDGDSWAASATITLDDGRRVEIRQDLAGRVDSRATDLDLGRDLSSDLIFDGSPDGSVWLGLNRRSFAATACIGQAQLLTVLEEADGLQQHLQQAAATAGTDATAAAALECLDTFRRDRVGLDRANSTRPLRRARDRVAGAEETLRQAHTEPCGVHGTGRAGGAAPGSRGQRGAARDRAREGSGPARHGRRSSGPRREGDSSARAGCGTPETGVRRARPAAPRPRPRYGLARSARRPSRPRQPSTGARSPGRSQRRCRRTGPHRTSPRTFRTPSRSGSSCGHCRTHPTATSPRTRR